ncbi:MAG TPA: IS110 family transposase [Terriglobia bacterium]|nr:IS110 family transposase [Terriglobia bacterium]
MKNDDEIVAWIGMDWADEAHEVCEYSVEGANKSNYAVEHLAESLQEWINQLRARYGGKRVAVVLEQARGGLIYALMSTDFISIYAVNPHSLAQFRKALYPSGAKSDPSDAELLEEMVRQNRQRFRAWTPGDEQTRSLQLLTEGRRKFVDDMTALTNQLTSALKSYYPQALDWAGELSSAQACAFLEKWPTLADLQEARAFRIREFYQKYGRPQRQVLDQRVKEMGKTQPLTTDPAVVMGGVMMVRGLVSQIEPLRAVIEKYDAEIARIFQQHPDRAVFESFPGAGKVLAPRLVAAFGADRDRFEAPVEMQQFSGIAPVTERSGKSKWVHRRWACPKFVLQTFHEFADQARKFSTWSKLYYQQQRARGSDHHAAIRALAYKWIRIMFRCWKDRRLYDDAIYTKSLSDRGSALAVQLKAAKV